MEKRAIRISGAKESELPFSHWRMAGATVYVSGQVGTHPITGEVVGPEIETQTRQALNNMRALLAEAGLGMANVVKTTVFLTKIADFQAMNSVYREVFAAPMPARSTVAVAALANPQLVVEIEAVAVK